MTKPFAFPTTFFSQIARIMRCEIKMLQVALCMTLKHNDLVFIDEYPNLHKK